MPQRPPIKAQQSSPAETLGSLNLGYNGYTDPTLTTPRQWIAANNIYSGAFGYLQRARFANVAVPNTGAAVPISSSAQGFIFPGISTFLFLTSTPHGLSAGQEVVISGVSQPIYNGTFVVVSVPNPVEFNVGTSTTNASPGSGGQVAPAYTAQGAPFTTFKYFALPGLSSYLLADSNGKLFSFDTGNQYSIVQRINPIIDPAGLGTSQLNGPWSREVLQNIVYEMNGQVKQAGRNANALTVENLGIDAPDVSPQVVITAGASVSITNIQRQNGTVTVTLGSALTVPGGNGIGMVNVTISSGDTSFAGTFVVLTGSGTTTLTWAQSGQNTSLLTPTGTVNTNITKSIGRSYAWAWENANKSHVSAPSPATQYVQYNAQNGQIQLIEQGTISYPPTTSGNTVTVTGTGTAFSTSWVGKYLWVSGTGTVGRITSVTSPTTMTFFVSTSVGTTSSRNFMIYDPQVTHIRLYQTADGGATYFRTQRNAFDPTSSTLTGAGLEFFDNAQAEPPNFPFTTEVSQLYNVPPPIGAFIKEYQQRLLIYGGTIPGQTFFYTNIESTTVGLTQESCAPLNQITLPIQNANISGMADLPGSLIIWSDKQDMFRLTGLLADNTPLGLGSSNTSVGLGTAITALPYQLGCANPFAVVVTPLGAIWVTSNRELWLYTDKYAPRNIGRPIQDILSNVSPANLSLIRMSYFHSLNRNWVAIALPIGASNNTLILLDLDLLASNGQPSFFTFDMATNHPAFWKYSVNCSAIETVYEAGGNVRLLVGSTDLVEDVDYQTGLFGTEIPVPGASVTTHAWGNDSPQMIKRPAWVRFNTNRDPSVLSTEVIVGISVISRSLNTVTVTTVAPHGLTPGSTVFINSVSDPSYNGVFLVAATPTPTTFTYVQSGANSSSSGGVVTSGWSFAVQGIDDDFYTFQSPLVLSLVPGVNDSSSLCGNPNLATGEPFRHSPEMFRIGAVNFVMGRRLLFTVNFPSSPGVNYALRSIQLGFGPSPPR